MKYEDWIKYEEIRQANPGSQDWIRLPEDDAALLFHHPQPQARPDQPRVWTMIVQVIQSRWI